MALKIKKTGKPMFADQIESVESHGDFATGKNEETLRKAAVCRE